MVGVLTISTQFVVKTAAICNLGPGAHACQAEPAPSCRRTLHLRVSGSIFRTGKTYSFMQRALATSRRQSRVPSRRPVMGISSLAFLFPCSPSARTYMFGHAFCSCRSTAAILAMTAGWTVGRAWVSRFLAPVKRYEHLIGANSLMKMRKTRKSRS